MIAGFFYATVAPAAAARGRRASRDARSSSTRSSPGCPQTAEAWTFYLAIIAVQTIVDQRRRGLRREGDRAERGAPRRRSRGSRRRSAENAGLHAQLLTQAREAGVLDERQRMAREIHDTIAQGLTGIITQLEAADQARDRPGRPRPPPRRTPSGWPARAWPRRAGRSRRRCPAALETADAARGARESRASGPSSTAIPVGASPSPASVIAPPPGDRGRAPADGPGGARQRRQARRAPTARRPDAVVHGRRRDARRPRRRRRVPVPERPDPAPGGGFGLTGMRQRVARVAGSLAIESEPGGGTAVSARVPAIAGRRPSGAPVSVSPIRLLIVDDHPVVRDGLRGMLAGEPGPRGRRRGRDGAEALRPWPGRSGPTSS